VRDRATPPPWNTIHAEIDVRPGGSRLITMQGPDGTPGPHCGGYREVIPEQRLVFTDAWALAATP
jgi:uncharacterized protein YndB with AHSA1/START domain